MAKKGYSWEYKIMQRFKKNGIILRLSIGSYADYLCIDFIKQTVWLIECKKRIKKWYPNNHDKDQFKRLLDLNSKISEQYSKLWKDLKLKIIYEIKEGKQEKTLSIEEVKNEYFKNIF